MVYKDETTSIPETAEKGEVYKLTQNIGDITNIPLITNNNILMENVSNIDISYEGFNFAMFSSNRFEIPSSILALVSDLLGTTEFSDEAVEIPTKTISIIVDGNTYNIKANFCQWSKHEDEGVYAINLVLGGECPELADDYLQIAGYNDDDEFVVNYQNVSINIGDLEYRANSYILYNGNEWVEFSRNDFTDFITQSNMETYVTTRISNKANMDLSNVDNEIFKAKAEESGIGFSGGVPEHTHTVSDITDIDDLILITVDEIDAICATSVLIPNAEEGLF